MIPNIRVCVCVRVYRLTMKYAKLVSKILCFIVTFRRGCDQTFVSIAKHGGGGTYVESCIMSQILFCLMGRQSSVQGCE